MVPSEWSYVGFAWSNLAVSQDMLPAGEITLKQEFQMISGTLASGGANTAVSGKLRGDQITFTAGSTEYTGQVKGDRIEGSAKSAGSTTNWVASRVK